MTTRTLRDLTFVVFLAFPLALAIHACGPASPTPVTGGVIQNVTGQNTPTPTATPTPTYINLSPFAKIAATSTFSDAYAADLVADGVKPLATNTDGFMWRPTVAAQNSSSISFTWNSQIQIQEIRLWDDPIVQSQITSGRIKFSNSIDSSVVVADKSFTALPDDASTPGIVTGPDQAVTQITILIDTSINTSGNGLPPGFGEIEVMGVRVSEAIASADIIPYSQSSAVSPTANSFDPNVDNGPNRSFKSKDGNPSTAWLSNASLNNASIKWSFDLNYAISQIVLTDLPTLTNCCSTNNCYLVDGSAVSCTSNIGQTVYCRGGTWGDPNPHFVHGYLQIGESPTKVEFRKAAATQTVSVPFGTPAVGDQIIVSFDPTDGTVAGNCGNKNVGVAEFSAIGSFNP